MIASMITKIRNSFLFPSTGKLLLATLLFFIYGWMVWPPIVISMISDWQPVGFPLIIHASSYLCPPPTGICVDFVWVAFIVDVVFWYLVSAIIVCSRANPVVVFACIIASALGIWLIMHLLSMYAPDVFFAVVNQ